MQIYHKTYDTNLTLNTNTTSQLLQSVTALPMTLSDLIPNPDCENMIF